MKLIYVFKLYYVKFFLDEDINILPVSNIKQSLGVNTQSINESELLKNAGKANKSNKLDVSFDSSFQELHTPEGLVENTIDDNLSDSLPSLNPKKRTADALFGDIDDIDDIVVDDYLDVSAAKKHKGNEKLKQDLELIDCIVQMRNAYKKSHHITSVVSVSGNTSIKNAERDKRNLSNSVPRYPFIRVKSFSGQDVYIRCHSEDFEKEETKRLVQESSFQGVMGDNFKKIWDEAQVLVSFHLN